jgi:hypothetical protein
MREGQLLAVYPDGRHATVDNSYESIKDAMNGAIIALVGLPGGEGLFVDDNGMLESLALNVPASMFCGQALYGPVVLCGPPDDEGETQPPSGHLFNGLTAMAGMWGSVCADAVRKGQQIFVPADPDTIPPAQIVEMSNEDFDAYLRGEWPR